ncbi:hypothetical protein B0H11DRAFT_2232280 [Mycena galericulata]|nr:hypothetical protein B0H11DRAFT_2232280 [Mycena galericulata]
MLSGVVGVGSPPYEERFGSLKAADSSRRNSTFNDTLLYSCGDGLPYSCVPPHRTLRLAVLSSTRNLFLTQSSRRLCTLSDDEPAQRPSQYISRPPFFGDTLDSQPLYAGPAISRILAAADGVYCRSFALLTNSSSISFLSAH